MEFSHFSAESTLVPRSVEQERPFHKPFGLWLSVDGEDDWPAWCQGAQFGLDRLTYRFRVQLADGWLHLGTPEAVTEFGNEFGVDLLGDYGPRLFGDGGPVYHHIDWPRVAEKWPGIVIAPYLFSMRLDMTHSWYYTWDVASGCVWDASIIESVEPVA